MNCYHCNHAVAYSWPGERGYGLMWACNGCGAPFGPTENRLDAHPGGGAR